MANDTEAVDLRANTKASDGNFLVINPRGGVPALQLDDGSILTQNFAILQYIGDRADVPAFKPAAGLIDHKGLQEALGFCDDLHVAFGGLFAPNLDADMKVEVKLDHPPDGRTGPMCWKYPVQILRRLCT